MGEFIEEVFGIIDKVIIAVVVIAVLGTVAMIAYVAIKSELEEKERIKKEELRKKRLEKIPIEVRKCSNCRYGKKVVLSDMTVYECSSPNVWDNHVIESNEIGCQAFDPLLVQRIINNCYIKPMPLPLH